MKLVLSSAAILGLLLLFVPIEQVSAQSGFVPCDGADCSACDFVSMINVIIKWLFGMIFVLFAVLMTKAGFGLVTSGGNQAALDAAKSHFQNALVGVIIVMAGWLIVDTIMKGVVGGGATGAAEGEIKGYGPWSEVKCQVQTKAIPAVIGTGFPPVDSGTFFYRFYERDTVNNCKIARSGSGADLAACSAAQTTAINAATGETYLVDICDDSATLPTPPTWSTLPACGVSNTACTPLTPYSGADPLNVVWEGTDPQLKKCAQKMGGTVTSAFRPQAYQNHLKEIHTKWCVQGLQNNTEPSCSAVKAAVSAEFSKHTLNCNWPVASQSNHTSGKAVDISGANSANANANCLVWFGAGDPVHYTLKAGCTCN